MHRSGRLAALLLISCALAAPARADLYTWTDARGRVHMTDDLSQVPPAYRAEARARARSSEAPSRRWNALGAPEGGSPAPPAAGSAAQGSARRPATHVLAVERAGREMRVMAELDGGVRVPFVVDTGAMGCTIPAWAVEEMGIELDEEIPRVAIRGISGQPMLVPVVNVRSVKLGEAEVEDVEMAVLSTQDTGLLGMTFFNHFKVQTDPSRGTLTLEEIDLDTVEGVYGGLGERAWRAKFGYVHAMLDDVRRYKERFPSGFSDYEKKLEEIEAYWERQLDELETRASRAGVPRAWREWRE